MNSLKTAAGKKVMLAFTATALVTTASFTAATSVSAASPSPSVSVATFAIPTVHTAGYIPKKYKKRMKKVKKATIRTVNGKPAAEKTKMCSDVRFNPYSEYVAKMAAKNAKKYKLPGALSFQATSQGFAAACK